MWSEYLLFLCLLKLASSIPAPPIYMIMLHEQSQHLDNSTPPQPTQNTTNFPYYLAPGQASNYNGDPSFNFLNISNPQPIHGDLGSSDPGPHNSAYDQQNPDTLARPLTDSGSVQQAKWLMCLSTNRLTDAGWARQQNIGVLPAAKEMAGVDMRLEPNAYRELHCTPQALAPCLSGD